jgi:aspartyl-tRNA synthetase
MFEVPPRRTHTCGALRASDIGATVTLDGWVASNRDLGGCAFIDLRDRYGVTQVKFDPTVNAALAAAAAAVRPEWVVGITGVVVSRGTNTNKQIPTGEIEVEATEIVVLNQAETPPFPVRDEVTASEELRLQHRFVDLRRRPIQKNIVLRAEVTHVVRQFLHENGFLELETPILTKSTPEGARDYLVPSRVHGGEFYALPQSPQLFKQLYMIAGFDRYYQICRCFRDEDLRADRQPEFTQIDMEMSFIDREDIYELCERLMSRIWKFVHNHDIQLPIPRISYDEAMARFGVDNPDMRYGLELQDLSALSADGFPFPLFADAVAKGGVVKGIVVPNGGDISRKSIDEYTAKAAIFGAKGLGWAKLTAEGWTGGISKFFDAGWQAKIAGAIGAKEGDLLLFVADLAKVANPALGNLRKLIAAERGFIPADSYKFVWVTDFPLLDYDAEAGRWVAMHHPFTSPRPEDVPLFDTNPGEIRARAYDLVLNGIELGGGSIRIHDTRLQSKLFSLLGIGEEEANQKFGFLLKALKSGAPPHGGIAFGFDRLMMLLSGATSLRDVIAYPKTASASCLMTEAPGPVDDAQLRELGIALAKPRG